MNEIIVKDFQSLPLRYAYEFLPQKGLQEEMENIRSTDDRNSIKRAKIYQLLKKNNLLNDFINLYWSTAKTEEGKKKINYYERILNIDDDLDFSNEDETERDVFNETKFAYEQDLQKYLIKNLGIIEKGLRLYEGEEGNEGKEFVIDDNKRIDILAIDKENVPVVIELKVSRGHERVIGQSLYYKNKIKKMFNVPKVRVIIISREITNELKIATEELKDVELYDYELSVKLLKIS